MKKNQTVQMMTPGQMKDIISALVSGVPAGMTFEAAQCWVGNKGRLTTQVRKIFSASNPYDDLLVEWQLFYKKFFGKEYDFSNIFIPEKPNVGHWRLLIIADLTLEQLYAKCKELFPCWRWTDENLDKKVVWNERNAKNGAYAIWVKDEVEADEELKNISANSIKERKITAETLAERLIHELKFFDETGKHLDIKNVTLCSGSRYDDGFVPDVDWDDDSRLSVDWYYPDFTNDDLRSRQVVS